MTRKALVCSWKPVVWPEGVSKVSFLPFESVLTGKGRRVERNPLLLVTRAKTFPFLGEDRTFVQRPSQEVQCEDGNLTNRKKEVL